MKVFHTIARISGRKILFALFAEKIVLVGHFTSFLIHYYCIDTNFLFIRCSRITVVYVHANVFRFRIILQIALLFTGTLFRHLRNLTVTKSRRLLLLTLILLIMLKCIELVPQGTNVIALLFVSLCYAQAFRKTCQCDLYLLTPHFYIVKLGFTGVYTFSYFCSKT